MTNQDIVLLHLVAWRENRGGGTSGMQSVINVIMNRATNNKTSPYQECVRPEQFSSITTNGDPELTLWPAVNDPQWTEAQSLAQLASLGSLTDLTSGSTLYYAPHSIASSKTITLSGKTYPFPESWNESVVQFMVEIAGQLFFKENS